MDDAIDGSGGAEEIEGAEGAVLKRRSIRLLPGLAALLFLSAAAGAKLQGQAQDQGPVVTFELADVARLESWSFFEPYPGGGDPTYTLLGNRAMLSVGMRSRRVDLRGAFQYSQLLGLPRDATGPGPLGPGATYFEASRAPSAYQLYIRAMSVRLKANGGLTFEAGRFDFSSAADGVVRSAAVERLTRERLAGRLIGAAEWTPFERAFDGARLDVSRSRWRLSSSLMWPTQGAFEESANPTMTAVRVVTGAITGATGALDATSAGAERSGEWQVFAIHYRDRRPVLARPDNSGLIAPAVDLGVATFGASHVGALPTRAGQFEHVVWAARQFGQWYGEDHRAFSAAIEAGYELRARFRPRFAVGFSHASGDDDPRDERHGTFFPLLPTTAPAWLGATFAEMNLRRVSAGVRIAPSPRLALSASVARLSLARPEDRWYSGTGATATRGTYFGFSVRPSGFSSNLGTLFETAADVHLSDRWQLNATVGTIGGGEVVRRQFAGTRLFVFSLESRLRILK